MNATRKIIVIPKTEQSIRSEFERLLAIALERGWDELEVLFGWVWGECVYGNEWNAEVMSPEELRVKVDFLEGNEDGVIAGDDLFVTVLKTGVQFKMSHENFIQF